MELTPGEIPKGAGLPANPEKESAIPVAGLENRASLGARANLEKQFFLPEYWTVVKVEPTTYQPLQATKNKGNGQNWIRTSEGVSQRIYSPPRLATSVSTLFFLRRAYLAGAA